MINYVSSRFRPPREKWACPFFAVENRGFWAEQQPEVKSAKNCSMFSTARENALPRMPLARMSEAPPANDGDVDHREPFGSKRLGAHKALLASARAVFKIPRSAWKSSLAQTAKFGFVNRQLPWQTFPSSTLGYPFVLRPEDALQHQAPPPPPPRTPEKRGSSGQPGCEWGASANCFSFISLNNG